MSAETFKLDEKKEFWSKIMKSSSNEPEDNIHPLLHSTYMHIFLKKFIFIND